MRMNDLANQRFGRLVATSIYEKRGKNLFWLCKCDCGNEVYVRSYSLRCGDTQSCGCLRTDAARRAGRKRAKYPVSRNSKNNRLFRIYSSMKGRCRNKDVKAYGAKNISICSDWNNYWEFHKWAISNGYSDDLTIDRIDNNEGYSPENCRWVDRKVQANNMTTNHVITYLGETKNLGQWAEKLGMKPSTLGARIKSGWDIEDAFLIPVGKGGENKKIRRV